VGDHHFDGQMFRAKTGSTWVSGVQVYDVQKVLGYRKAAQQLWFAISL
jgi:hypothetical protein